MLYCNKYYENDCSKETNNVRKDPNTRMQGLFDLHRKEFSYIYFPKKNCCGQGPKLPARMKNLAQGWLSRLKKQPM